MRHFHHLPSHISEELFERLPTEFDRGSEPGQLGMALGGTLYCPATRPNLAADIEARYRTGVMSVVCDLEDAVADGDCADGERNLVRQLRELAATDPDGPLIFIRVRRAAQILDLVERLGAAVALLSGFVLPKFLANAEGEAALRAVEEVAKETGLPLYAMPVLETPEIVHAESRVAALAGIRELLDAHRPTILAVRVGATDLSGWYGLRRPADLTIWDIRVVADALSGIVNAFGRADGTGYLVTGPVWEYFGGERVLKPQLRTTPFAFHHSLRLRSMLVERALDGLIREVVLDRANGLNGKTIIHPSHAAAVHAFDVVTHEEYVDAAAILAADGGALRSQYRNKMNEAKPHRAWAERTLLRAEVFGVAREEISFVDFLEADFGTAYLNPAVG